MKRCWVMELNLLVGADQLTTDLFILAESFYEYPPRMGRNGPRLDGGVPRRSHWLLEGGRRNPLDALRIGDGVDLDDLSVGDSVGSPRRVVSCPAGVDRPFHAGNHGLMHAPCFGEQETP